ncbi:M16 family metallopeptidase [Asticcacaulis solisilvae]|uniref:M16 family metallopeptidase n=1 Tax=Asticcacaulis solisilvae TaxID=1217274 RepID=UPI003FD88333
MLRTLLAASTAMTLMLVPVMAGPAFAAPSLPAAISGNSWPQTDSDLKPDARLRFGRLDNGMRYILYRNPTKARGTAMRFQIAAGSMEEADTQRGLAHFVEHMAFRGSKNLHEGELEKVLEAQGFNFGNDVNAFTDYETTDYVLNLPGNGQTATDSALYIFREIAGNLTFAPEAIEKERGVILGEERMRASADARVQQAWIETAYPQSLYARRNPIGLLDTIRTAPRQAIVDYYETWYRPELATLIVVGDFDPAKMEKRIRDVFGDWAPKKAGPVPHVDYGTRADSGVKAALYTEKNLYEGVGVTWMRPYIDAPDGTGARTRGFLKTMVADITTNRLAELAEAPDAPFLSASIDYDNDRLEGNTTKLWLTPKPGQQAQAFALALRTIDQVRQSGVTQAEVARYVAEKDVGIANMLKTTATEDSSTLADDFLGDIDDNGVSMAPEAIAALWTQTRPSVTAAAAATQAKVLFGGDGPLLLRTGEDAKSFDAGQLQAVYASAAGGKPAEAWANKDDVAWPYTDFGAAVKPARRTAVPVLGYVRYDFPNGVKLNIKPNTLVRNQITVSVRFGGGYELFSPSENLSLMQLHLYDIVDGGLGKLSKADADKALHDKTVEVNYDIDEDHASLSGTTTGDSFAAEMQVLMAYTVDPGFRSDSFATFKDSVGYLYGQIRSSPDFTLNIGLADELSSDDPRYRLPSEAQAKASDPNVFKAIYRRTMTHVPVEITIAGDVSEGEALKQVERTFATLPQVPEGYVAAPGADVIRLPADRTPRTFAHEGRADQGISVAVFPTTDALSSPDTTIGLEVLAKVFENRLSDDLREKQGQTYSVTVDPFGSEAIRNYGYLTVSSTVKPDADDTFFNTVMKVADGLRTAPVTEAELDRARNPLVQYLDDKMKTNEDWQATLPGLYGNPQRWSLRVGQYKRFAAITPATLQTLAETYLKPDTVLRARAKPETQ